MDKLRIGIIEDDEIVLSRYQDYINSSELAECMLAVNSVEHFVKYYQPFMQLDLILLDIGLPGVSGIKGIELIKKQLPLVEVIMFTVIENSDIIFKALRHGAVGYLLKGLSKVELERQLLLIRQGGIAVSPSIARKIIEHFSPSRKLSFLSQSQKLSLRETQIVKMLIDGLTYKEIADMLQIGINGVRYHIKNIYSKLQVKSRAEIQKKYLS